MLYTATQLGDRIGFKGYGVNRVLDALDWRDNWFAHGGRDKGAGTIIWPLSILKDPAFVDMMNQFLAGTDAGAVLKSDDPRRPEFQQATAKNTKAVSEPAPPAEARVSDKEAKSVEKLEVLTQPEILLRLVRLLDEAKERVLFVSPYTGLHRLRNINRSMRTALKRGVDVSLVVREPDSSTRHTKDAADAIRELVESGLKLYSLRDLHAKIYMSESHAILTSLNLWESSFNNSIEVGVWVAKEQDAFAQVLDFSRSELKPHLKPTTATALVSVGGGYGHRSR